MSVQDMIKKSVLESGMFSQYDIPKILAALAVALILGSVIYLVYQKFYVGVIFSRSFAVTLVGMTVRAYLYGNTCDQQQYCDFSWYGWCIVYCTFSYSN